MMQKQDQEESRRLDQRTAQQEDTSQRNGEDPEQLDDPNKATG